MSRLSDKVSLFSAMFLSVCLGPWAHAETAPLAVAVQNEEATEIEELLSEEVDVNEAQADGMTALHWAAYKNDASLVKRLLDLGANASVQNRYGIHPLHLACLNGNAESVRALLGAGASPNATVNGGESVLMTAARTGKPGAVAALIEAGADVNSRERQQQTAIMWAAAEGNLEVVQLLMDAGADYQTPLESGFTPFFFAIREGRAEVVRLFLQSGENVNGAIDPEGRSGNRAPAEGTSPLILAIENGHYDLAVELLDAGADPNDQRSGFTPLHTLTWIRKPDIGESASGAPPPEGSGRRNTEQFVRELVARGADVNARLCDGKPAAGGRVSFVEATPFFMAADRADLDYMKLLSELGADPLVPNADGCTPLLVAAGVGSAAPEEEAGSDLECLAAVKFLLSLGADINAVDANGETAMHGAAYKNAPLTARFLYENGADIRIWNAFNKRDRTPLLIAEGYRPGNFKPSFETVEAITEIMLAEGVSPPTGPKPHHTNYSE